MSNIRLPLSANLFKISASQVRVDPMSSVYPKCKWSPAVYRDDAHQHNGIWHELQITEIYTIKCCRPIKGHYGRPAAEILCGDGCIIMMVEYFRRETQTFGVGNATAANENRSDRTEGIVTRWGRTLKGDAVWIWSPWIAAKPDKCHTYIASSSYI